jgi:hypothetical protein
VDRAAKKHCTPISTCSCSLQPVAAHTSCPADHLFSPSVHSPAAHTSCPAHPYLPGGDPAHSMGRMCTACRSLAIGHLNLLLASSCSFTNILQVSCFDFPCFAFFPAIALWASCLCKVNLTLRFTCCKPCSEINFSWHKPSRHASKK